MIRVVLADDHPVITDGLQRFFELAPGVQIIATAPTVSELRDSIVANGPEVVVVDLNMPGMHGATTISELVESFSDVKFIVFSMQPEDQYAIRLLQAGAKAYLSKSRSPDELLNAIRLAAGGGRYLTEEIATRLLTTPQTQDPAHQRFSAREREVFDALVAGKPTRQIARDLGISASTVHTYTERIKTKLDVESVQEMVSYAFRHALTQ